MSFVAFAIAADFTVPYRDDWDCLREILDHPLSLATLAVPVDSHLIPLTRLLTALQYRWEGAVGHLLLGVALLSQLAIGALLIREIRRRWSNAPHMAAFVSGVALTPLFFNYQLQSMVFDAVVAFPLVQLFTVLALVCHVTALDAETPGRRAVWALGALIAATGAIVSFSNGLAVPWVLLALSVLDLRRRWPVFLWFAFGLSTAVLRWTLPHGAFTSGPSVVSVWAMAGYVLAFFASFVGQASSVAAVLLGSIVAGAGAFVLWVTAREGHRAPRIERVCAGLILFAILTVLMSAPARACGGLIQGAQSRYATFTFVCWAALVIVAFSRRRNPGSPSERRLTTGALLASLLLLPAQLFIGAVWIAKADHVAAAGQALVVDVDDEESLATLQPGALDGYALVQRLKASGDPAFTSPRIGLRLPQTTTRACAGRLALLRPAGTRTGWRIAGELGDSASDAVVVDRDGVVRGLARPAPVVPELAPRPLDVVRAVARAIARAEPRRTWVGFTQEGAGPPFAVIAFNGGDVVCRAECSAGEEG